MTNPFGEMRHGFLELMVRYADMGYDIVDIQAAMASAELEARVSLNRTLDARQRYVQQQKGEGNGTYASYG